MIFFPDSTVAEGMVYSASDDVPYIFGDGCIFTGCTFINPCTFGDGCIFVGCTLVDAYPSTKNTQPHRTGTGCVFSEGTMFNYTIVGDANVFGDGWQIGVRPNIPGTNMVITPDSKNTPAVSSVRSGCETTCGHMVITGDGTQYQGPFADGQEEKKGGVDVNSSGLCGEGCED